MPAMTSDKQHYVKSPAGPGLRLGVGCSVAGHPAGRPRPKSLSSRTRRRGAICAGAGRGAMIAVYITSRVQGQRWSLSDEDEVEVWRAPGSALVFVLSGAVMRALVQHHLESLAPAPELGSVYASRVGNGRAARAGSHPVARERREARRRKRRSRRR